MAARAEEMLETVLTALQQPIGDSHFPLWVLIVLAAAGLLACWLWVAHSGFDSLTPTWHRELNEEARAARARQRTREANEIASLHHDLHMRPFQQTGTGRSAAEVTLEQRAAQKAAQIAAQERSRASQGAAARRLEDAEAGIEAVEQQYERSRAHRRRAWRRTQGGAQEAVSDAGSSGITRGSSCATVCAGAAAARETSWVDAYEQELARMD